MRERSFDGSGVHWINQVTREGRVQQSFATSRILYHVFLGLAELERVLGGSFAAGTGIA